MQQYYVYQHVRLDTNTIFYIGIGKKNPARTLGHNTEFSRAYERAKRSDFWKSIASKTDIRIDILFQSDDLYFIKQKEIDLIKIYGRKCCDKDGILVNFDVGGGLNTGPKTRGITIYQLNLDNTLVRTWSKSKDVTNATGWLKSNIVACCRGRQRTAYGYKWSYTAEPYKFTTCARKRNSNHGVGILAIDRRTLSNMEFRTTEECAKYFGLHRATIDRYLNRGKKHKTHDIRYKKWEEHTDTHPAEAFEKGWAKQRTTKKDNGADKDIL